MKWAKGNAFVLVAYVVAFVTFVIDVLTQGGIAVWALYFIAVVLTQKVGHSKAPYVLAAACTGLLIVGLLATSHSSFHLVDMIDRATGIGLVWVTAAVLTHNKRREETLRESERVLRESQSVAALGHYTLDVFTGKWTSSELLDDIFGIDQHYARTVDGWLQIVHPDDRSDMQEYFLQHVLKTGHEFDREYRIVRIVDGNDRWVHGRGKLTFDGEGNPVAMIGTIQDITERKQAEDRVRNSEEQFRLISENVEDLIAVLDLEGRRVYNSPSYRQLLGDPGRFSGSDSFQEVYPDDRERIKATFYKTVNTGIGQRTEYRFIASDGSIRHIESQGSVIRAADGKVKNVVIVSRDITLRKHVEEELRHAEEKYRGIFNGVPVGLYQSTLDGVYLTANDKMAEILGFTSPQELMAATSDLREEFYVKSGRRAQFVERVREEGAVYGFESQAYRKDRSIIWVSEDARALYDKHGKMIGFEGTTTDITARKHAGESVQRLLRAVEQANDIIFMTDVSGRIKYINPSFTKTYGYKEQEAFEQTPRILKSGAQEQSYYATLWRTILAGQNARVELINKTKTGALVIVESTVSPVFDDEVGLSGFIAVQRDVTSERKHEEERKALEKELFQVQKLESIGTLAGGIAHDFNNVLTIILGYITMLQKYPGDVEKSQESSEVILNAVQRGTDLVRQILMFARKSDAEFASLDLNELVTEVQNMIKGTFPKTIAVEASLDPKIPAIEADRTQVYQTVLNLCVNARDAMPDGGTISLITGKIRGEVLKDRFPEAEGEEFITASIRDTGIGMDEATKQRIFEPFFTTKEKGKGTGLGLAVVYGIMRSHSGYIDVQSTPGQGTEFKLFFPIHSKAQTASKLPTEEQESVAGGTETILVIEDETILRDLLRATMEARGYSVFTASDGEKGVRLYKKHKDKIALVISDFGLPKLDGTRVFGEIRKINPHAKILIASGYVDPGVMSGLLKAGARGFLQKPFGPTELLRRVRELLD